MKYVEVAGCIAILYRGVCSSILIIATPKYCQSSKLQPLSCQFCSLNLSVHCYCLSLGFPRHAKLVTSHCSRLTFTGTLSTGLPNCILFFDQLFSTNSLPLVMLDNSQPTRQCHQQNPSPFSGPFTIHGTPTAGPTIDFYLTKSTTTRNNIGDNLVLLQ